MIRHANDMMYNLIIPLEEDAEQESVFLMTVDPIIYFIYSQYINYKTLVIHFNFFYYIVYFSYNLIQFYATLVRIVTIIFYFSI